MIARDGCVLSSEYSHWYQDRYHDRASDLEEVISYPGWVPPQPFPAPPAATRLETPGQRKEKLTAQKVCLHKSASAVHWRQDFKSMHFNVWFPLDRPCFMDDDAFSLNTSNWQDTFRIWADLPCKVDSSHFEWSWELREFGLKSE